MKNKHLISLKNKNAIASLFTKNVSSLHSKLFNLNFKKSNLNQLCFVIAPSKKKYKSAVVRNKIKRQIRQILQNTKIGGFDLAITVNENYFDYKFVDIEKELYNLLAKIK